MEGYTRLNVESFIKLTMGDLRGCEVVYGALPGEIFLEDGAKDAAGRLAKALMGESEQARPSAPVCPVCGGDTFRFLPEGGLRCMLCSSSGDYRWENGRLHIGTTPGEHPLFLSYGSASRHADWLREMKDEFLSRRKDLKAVAQEYTQLGTWIRPEKGD
jgi:hypothetical protein